MSNEKVGLALGVSALGPNASFMTEVVAGDGPQVAVRVGGEVALVPLDDLWAEVQRMWTATVSMTAERERELER